MRTRFPAAVLALAVSTSILAACGNDDGGDGGSSAPRTVTVATHDSWAMSEEVIAAFEEETGLKVKLQAHGDAGQLTNKLVLTKDHPLADAGYGVDNTFATRATEEGVFAAYESEALPESAQTFRLPGDAADRLTPIDYSDVCLNIDDSWFAKEKVAPPATFDDLLEPAYRDLLVVPGATTSSPGLAFLVATIGTFGDDGWQDYWRGLVDNGLKVVAGWTDAYTVDFTAGGGGGDRPIVLSYSSSPPFTVPEGGDEPTTSALLDTCFRQVEYAGVLEGAENPEGAEKFIDFMLGEQFQAALPDNMYVYPVDEAVALPEGWQQWAPTATEPIAVRADEIAANRAEWLREWRDLTSR